jgi:hypothetical protein
MRAELPQLFFRAIATRTAHEAKGGAEEGRESGSQRRECAPEAESAERIEPAHDRDLCALCD